MTHRTPPSHRPARGARRFRNTGPARAVDVRMTDATDVVDEPERHRFRYTEDGIDARLVYRVDGDRLTLVHTEVPEAISGRGIAGRLVHAAAERAARTGETVLPWCPYARQWLQDHWTSPPASASTGASLPGSRARSGRRRARSPRARGDRRPLRMGRGRHGVRGPPGGRPPPDRAGGAGGLRGPRPLRGRPPRRRRHRRAHRGGAGVDPSGRRGGARRAGRGGAAPVVDLPAHLAAGLPDGRGRPAAEPVGGPGRRGDVPPGAVRPGRRPGWAVHLYDVRPSSAAEAAVLGGHAHGSCRRPRGAGPTVDEGPPHRVHGGDRREKRRGLTPTRS